MKALASAKTSLTTNGDGQLLLTIDHDTVRGVSPPMLRWWFEHIGGTIEHAGKPYPRYLLWHPRDHIHWELAREAPAGGAGKGASFRIVEAFAANPDFYFDSTEYVEKLDEEGISLLRRVAGVEVFRLEHRFLLVPDGTQYRSRMVVGMRAGIPGRLFNRYVLPRVFSEAAARAWLTHNVEEVGMFENFLPRLYREQVRGERQLGATRVSGSIHAGERIVRAGESWTEKAGDKHAIMNKSDGTIRVVSSALFPKGVARTTVVK